MTKPEAKVQLLHALGYLYCRHGQVKRALVLLLLAGRLAPRDVGVLRTLAYAFICDGAGQSALRVLDHLDTLGEGTGRSRCSAAGPCGWPAGRPRRATASVPSRTNGWPMSMPAELQRVLLALSRRSDLVLALIVIVAVLMMIIPLPPLAIDMLIAMNIAASVLITLVAFYVTRPVELSALPAIVLLATLFRLTLTISTTRLILLDADAGEVVATFGSFVIGGNVAVGLVIFLVITISQFVVITKGAERVAEVAARFSLDALPGKQMAIDNDLRNGDIEQDEARRRRRDLERESQLYGAMDGAMKFVKGDAIAGLVIVLVALIGGLAIGTVQRGMSFGDAAALYSVLTVGDGLVAQIPALLISVAAGMVVTRVASETQRDIGSEIGLQLLREPRALALAAVVVACLGFVPGFPTPVFLVLAAGLAAGAVLRSRRPSPGRESAPSDLSGLDAADIAQDPPVAAAPARARYRVSVLLGAELERAIPADLFRGRPSGSEARCRPSSASSRRCWSAAVTGS